MRSGAAERIYHSHYCAQLFTRLEPAGEAAHPTASDWAAPSCHGLHQLSAPHMVRPSVPAFMVLLLCLS